MKSWKSVMITGTLMLTLFAAPAQAGCRNPMVEAAEQGNLAEVKAYLECDRRTFIPNYGINSCDWAGETALHAAARNGHTEIVRYLISKGADLNAPDYYLIGCEGATIHAQDWQTCETPLHEACKNGNVEIIKLLVENGAQLDPVDSGHNTPLSNAAAKGHLDAVKYLVGKNARMDMEDVDGHTPIWMAVVNGHAPVVEFMLASGSPVGTFDYERMMLNQVSKNDQIIQMLKRRGLH